MIIAHFSNRRSLAYVLVCLATCIIMYSITIYHPSGTTLREYLESKGIFRYQLAVFTWIGAGLLIVRLLTILRQIILRKSIALWTIDGRLVFLNIYWNIVYSSVALSDIVRFRLQEGIAARAGIVVCLRNGRERLISTWLLSEQAGAVLEQLQNLHKGAENL
jgi:hypothetical protein